MYSTHNVKADCEYKREYGDSDVLIVLNWFKISLIFKHKFYKNRHLENEYYIDVNQRLKLFFCNVKKKWTSDQFYQFNLVR